MWILKKLTDGTTKYLVSEQKSYTIGRKNCNIVLEQDPSLSRKHCTIYIAKQGECPFSVNTITGVWVVDEQSKYGTYLKDNNDWVKINPGENKQLSHGSVIKFGLMENVWSLEFRPLIACVSGIPTEQKKKIENTLQAIDGILKNTWSSHCSLMIVKEITLTVKVVLALIHGVPIVTPNYLQKVVECVRNQEVLPKYEDYKPEIKEVLLEKSLVSLDCNKNRKELFKGMKFIIPTKKQLETLREVIVSAGGNVELLSCNGNWKRFGEDNVVMIQLPFNNTGIPEELIKSVKEITVFLKKNYEKRVIPESEIAQAVAYASTEKFCNPANNWFNIRIEENKDVNLGPVIVEDTPIVSQEVSHSSGGGVVPCSAAMYSEPLNVDDEPSVSKLVGNVSRKSERKRTHPPNQNHETPSKKAKSQKVSNEDQPKTSTPSQNQIQQSDPKKTDSKSSNKKNQTATRITNYFQKQNKPTEEKTPKLTRQPSSDFWNCDTVSNVQSKRKISTESDDSNDIPSKKKSKTTASELNIETPREIVEVVETSNSSEKSVSCPVVKKTLKNEKENDLSDFFEKDRMDAIDDLNTTIFSLKLISPAYLKNDGSLIEPPSEPVNVKRFKKQKLFSVVLPSVEENEEEILKGNWIEPHSNRYDISVHH